MGKWIGIGMLVLGLLLLAILAPLALALPFAGGGAGACVPAEGNGNGTVAGSDADDIGPIPGEFIGFYQGAAAQFGLGEKGPSMLAGIHFHETSFSTNVATSGPYVGPMAIIKADWDAWGVDGDNDGEKDIMNEADAIYAAAKILKSHGGSKNWRDTLASYNAGPENKSAGYGYADSVMEHAEKHHVPATGGGDAVSSDDDCLPTTSEFSGECTANGIAFGLPGSSQADREAVFGKANSAAAKKPLTFFGKSLQAHEKVVPCLKAVEAEIKAKGLDDYKVRSIGGYHPRPGEPLYFFHMYGGAVDINPDTNPYCDCDTHDIPDSWVKIFEKYGFFWGGNFRTTKDWMHFEWHGEAP